MPVTLADQPSGPRRAAAGGYCPGVRAVVVERFGGEIATRPYVSRYVSVPPQTPHHGEHTVGSVLT